MNSRNTLGPGVEEYKEQYRSPLTYEQFRRSLNEYLRNHGAAELNDDELIRQIFELTVDCHKELFATEEMKKAFGSPDWRKRSAVAKRVTRDLDKLKSWLKTQSGKDCPLTSSFVRLLLTRVHFVGEALDDLDLYERGADSMVRNLLHSTSRKLRGSGPETGHIFVLNRYIAETLGNTQQAYRDQVIAACLVAGRLVFQSVSTTQAGKDILDTVPMKRSRAKHAYLGAEIVLPWKSSQKSKI